jgi:2-methylcitrate dehydratase
MIVRPRNQIARLADCARLVTRHQAADDDNRGSRETARHALDRTLDRAIDISAYDRDVLVVEHTQGQRGGAVEGARHPLRTVRNLALDAFRMAQPGFPISMHFSPGRPTETSNEHGSLTATARNCMQIRRWQGRCASRPPKRSRSRAAMITASDEIAELLATYATEADDTLDSAATDAAKAVLFDALAVAAGALRHRAAQAARRYAYRFPAGEKGCTIWGTARRTSAEAATLANGVLLRCYDYNDLYVGKRSAAHPSDIVAGLIAMAEWTGASGRQLLSSLALGYEITLDLLDTLATGPAGWDYANLTAIGAACAVARLIGLNRAQTREALAITVVPHLASDEIESGDLNARGDLTMWKRFNGADAIRQAVYACLLAEAGAEGVVRPFTGKLGLLNKLRADDDPLPYLRARVAERRRLSRIGQVTMKRWPVGSRAQSAIQAALAARAKLADPAQIESIRVAADPSAYEHLVRSRQDAWHPMSRETADHSLPYIVAAAVLDGMVGTDSFAPRLVLDPARQRFVEKVQVSPRTAKAGPGDVAVGYASLYRTQVEIALQDGTILTGDAAVPPGHPDHRFTAADLETKLREAAAADIDVDALAKALWAADRLASVGELTALIAARPGQDLDGESAQ